MSGAGVKFEYLSGQDKPWRASLRGKHYGMGTTIHEALDDLAAYIEEERAVVAESRKTLPPDGER